MAEPFDIHVPPGRPLEPEELASLYGVQPSIVKKLRGALKATPSRKPSTARLRKPKKARRK